MFEEIDMLIRTHVLKGKGERAKGKGERERERERGKGERGKGKGQGKGERKRGTSRRLATRENSAERQNSRKTGRSPSRKDDRPLSM